MRGGKMLFFSLCLILALDMFRPVPVMAKESAKKVVRVGWYDSAFFKVDEFGRFSGYGYEYHKRLSIYNGWTYEYVHGSWPELFEMLMEGKIDILTDVSYTEERAEKILYSAEAMGSESYHLYVAADNTVIRPDDLSTLNGKRIGVNKNSVQEQLLKNWVDENDISPEIIELTMGVPDMFDKLTKGEYDAIVTLDTYGNTANVVPVSKIGYTNFFFGINKNRPDLKKELDVSMNRLFDENRDFNQKLANKYNRSSALNSYLTAEEKEWVDNHDVIRVGYRDDYLPFCNLDKETGELSGTLADYLKFAETCEKNAKLSFETKPFASTRDALLALGKGEIDCIFPVSISSYDGEEYSALVTDSVVSTEVFIAVRTSERKGIDRDREMNIALAKNDPNYEAFIMDKFPKWSVHYYEDWEGAIAAVSTGKADGVLVNNYRISQMSTLFEKYKLSMLATGEYMDISFAVNEKDDSLYSILNKVTRLMSEETLNTSLTSYGFRDERITFDQFVRDNLIYFIATVAIIAVIFLLLVLRNLKIQAREAEGRRIISETERDPLTDLYNWNYFLVYANRFFREHPDKPMDAVILNINQFHSLNALHGWEFGDTVLRALSEEIKEFIKGTDGIASRFMADRFDLYCEHREDWPAQLEKLQKKMNQQFPIAAINLRMGVKPWEKGMEPVQQFDRARTASKKTSGEFNSQAVIYDEEMGLREEREQLLMNDLDRALGAGELEVYYQPKYFVQNEKPMLSSAEALVRWRHSELGMISPGEFIPLFERSGQISALDNYVWTQAAKQIAIWREKYGLVLPMSVNLSRVDVFDPALESILDQIVRQNGLKYSDLKLEITESAYTENSDKLIRLISKLRQKGYEIEMDDFGSGYSSLNMISSMPIDVLKIDMGFVRNIDRNERDFHLVELIIDIARYLKVPVIAEGVENEKQLYLLKNAGCDLVQGYYFSRPLPAGDFEEKILGGGQGSNG